MMRERLTEARRALRRLFVCALTIALALVAGHVAQAQSGGARVVDAQLGTESTPDYQITDPSKSFAPEPLKIVCAWRVADVPQQGATLRGVWIATDTAGVAPPNYQIAEKSYPLKQTTMAGGVFSLSKPNAGWPPGQYRVELYLDDRLAQSLKFSIYTAAAAAAYAQIEPLTAQAEQLEARGDYRAGAAMLRRALALAEQALRPQHPDTAAPINKLPPAPQRAGADDESGQPFPRRLQVY